MTALQLLAIICAALLLQGVAGVGVIVWRRRSARVDVPMADAPESPAAAAGAWHGWRDFRVQRRHFEDTARSQCSFYLQPVDASPLEAFKPGQYLTFSVPVGDVADAKAGTGRPLTRCYSLSDRPDPAGYRITVKRMPAPRDRPDLPPGASSSHFHDQVREGDVLRVKAPSGRFFIDPNPGVPAVFIAGGIGITPMMSMLRWCAAEQPDRPVHLYYGVRNSADHAFKAVLQELAASHPAFKLHVDYSDPAPEDVEGRDYQHAGRVDLALLRRSLPHGPHQFYVCGPPPMMQSLVPALREWGVPESDIHFEAFGPASVKTPGVATNEPPESTAATFDVRFGRSGRSLVWDGQDANLLDFSERHGVVVDSGCRSGSCGACMTKLVSGAVDYAEKPDHAIAAGHCLLCVGRPRSPLELEA